MSVGMVEVQTMAVDSASTPVHSAPFGSPAVGGPPEEEQIVVTREDLPGAVSDTNWKVRKESYNVLRGIIVQAGGGMEPVNNVNSEVILTELDDLIPSILLDKNANALDGALQLALAYSQYCRTATLPAMAEKIAVSLVKGNGFTSPRPSAPKVAAAVVLKLMEVGADTQSLVAATSVLLEQGLTSRKPKLVQNSSSLLLEATYSFGAACLPLAAVASAIPKLLSHSNKKIRDTAMEILAEICRALGSKAPMNEVISKMKNAQVKELDTMMQKQPGPTPIKIGLRCKST